MPQSKQGHSKEGRPDVQNPPQLTAIAILSTWRPEVVADLLEMPAHWYQDSRGVLHGRPHGTEPSKYTTHTGTLKDALEIPTCPSKGCTSVRKLAGEAAGEAASKAQADAAELVALNYGANDLLGRPGDVLIETRRLLRQIASGRESADEPFKERLIRAGEEAQRLLQSGPMQRSIIEDAVKRVLHNQRDTPLQQLSTLLLRLGVSETGKSLVAHCDGSTQWVEAALKEAHTPLEPHIPVARLDDLDTPELRQALAEGASLHEALSTVRGHLITTCVHAIAPWWAETSAELRNDTRTALVVVRAEAAWLVDSRSETYRPSATSPLLVAPYVVGLSITNELLRGYSTPPAACYTDTAPLESELETITTLLSDRHNDVTSDELSHIVTTARALNRTPQRTIAVNASAQRAAVEQSRSGPLGRGA